MPRMPMECLSKCIKFIEIMTRAQKLHDQDQEKTFDVDTMLYIHIYMLDYVAHRGVYMYVAGTGKGLERGRGVGG